MGMDMFGIGNKPAMATNQVPQQGAALGGGGGNSVLSAVGGAQPMGKLPNAMGQGFAQQKSPMNQAAGGAWQQKPRQAFGQKPSPTAGQIPGAGGSNSMILAKQKAMQQQQAASQGGGLGPSNPLQQLQQTLAKQKGLTAPYEAQQQEQLQAQPQSPMQQAAEQMRGYDGPDLGSQDPRELARMGQGQPQLYGTTGQMPMNQVPELPVGNYGRPDVMDRGGIGPSAQLFGGQPMDAYQGMQQMNPAAPVQMDENGMEPRRGAR